MGVIIKVIEGETDVTVTVSTLWQPVGDETVALT